MNDAADGEPSARVVEIGAWNNVALLTVGWLVGVAVAFLWLSWRAALATSLAAVVLGVVWLSALSPRLSHELRGARLIERTRHREIVVRLDRFSGARYQFVLYGPARLYIRDDEGNEAGIIVDEGTADFRKWVGLAIRNFVPGRAMSDPRAQAALYL